MRIIAFLFEFGGEGGLYRNGDKKMKMNKIQR